MTQLTLLGEDEMSTADDLRKLVEELVETENTRNHDKANSILADDFIVITRSTGIEQNREELLGAIARSDFAISRRLVSDAFRVIPSEPDDLGAVRSVVTPERRTEPGDESKPWVPIASFRNLHVFEKRSDAPGEKWACILWQVTKLE